MANCSACNAKVTRSRVSSSSSTTRIRAVGRLAMGFAPMPVTISGGARSVLPCASQSALDGGAEAGQIGRRGAHASRLPEIDGGDAHAELARERLARPRAPEL